MLDESIRIVSLELWLREEKPLQDGFKPHLIINEVGETLAILY